VPAAGQGALALEARAGTIAPAQLSGVSDPDAAACVGAERSLTRALLASCHTPVGAHGRRAGSGDVELTAWVGRPDGSAWLLDRLTGDPESVGDALAQRMLAAGAADLLRDAELSAGRTAHAAGLQMRPDGERRSTA
jgi:hydroxymethylbilane synthase